MRSESSGVSDSSDEPEMNSEEHTKIRDSFFKRKVKMRPILLI